MASDSGGIRKSLIRGGISEKRGRWNQTDSVLIADGRDMDMRGSHDANFHGCSERIWLDRFSQTLL
jgi:hypothetical protein